jgi:glucokinase
MTRASDTGQTRPAEMARPESIAGGVIIGLDVGGTKVAGGLVTESDEIVARRERSAVVDGVGDPGLAVTRLVAEELAEAAREGGLRVDGIGAGFPEYVDPLGRLRSHEVLAWTIQPRELLADIAPCSVESDVRCAALGEGALGAARGLASFVFIPVGTGLSYALVEDGQVRRGVRGEAIALGELEVSRDVDAAATGSLERYASGRAIRERYERQSGAEVHDAAEVFGLAAAGDLAAGAVVDTAAGAIGAALATLVRILDPGAIVVGGGVSASGERWRSGVQGNYLARASARPDAPPILWASLGSDAGILGSAIAHRRREP